MIPKFRSYKLKRIFTIWGFFLFPRRRRFNWWKQPESFEHARQRLIYWMRAEDYQCQEKKWEFLNVQLTGFRPQPRDFRGWCKNSIQGIKRISVKNESWKYRGVETEGAREALPLHLFAKNKIYFTSFYVLLQKKSRRRYHKRPFFISQHR